MKKLFFLFAASACLVACGGSSTESTTSETTTETVEVTSDVDLTSTESVLAAYETAVASGDIEKAESLYDKLIELAEEATLDEAQAKRLLEAGTEMMKALGQSYEALYSDLEDVVGNIDLDKLSASLEEVLEDVDMEELEETAKNAMKDVAELAKEIDEEDIEKATETVEKTAKQATKAIEKATEALGDIENFDFEF